MKILCLDDEQLALQMLEMCVKKVKPDAEVLAFDDQDDLLEEAEKNGCDVAFLDIHMRGMNGVEVAKRLKQSNPKMNIIFVTGFSEYKADAMDMRASGYIMKPVTKEEVARELEELRFPIIPKNDALLKVQCFGNFDVFLPDGTPVHFERSRSKEIFAYLVHRHGSSCSTREIAAALFDAQKAVNKSYNALSVNPAVLDCDYYRFAELDAGAVNAYANEYMSQYYWADFMFNDF